MYSDICGAMQVDSIRGNGYFVTFIDDFSRKLLTYLIKRNDEVLEVFKKFKSMMERQSDHKIKTPKIDGGVNMSQMILENFVINKALDIR